MTTSASAENVLDKVVSLQLEHGVPISGARLRKELQYADRDGFDRAVESLIPSLCRLELDQRGDDHYQATILGLAQSKEAVRLREACPFVLSAVGSIFQENPDFTAISWSDFRRLASELQDTDFRVVDGLMRYFDLGRGAGGVPGSDSYAWGRHPEIERLCKLSTFRDLLDYRTRSPPYSDVPTHPWHASAARPTTRAVMGGAKRMVADSGDDRGIKEPEVALKHGDLAAERACQLVVLPCSTKGTYKTWVQAIVIERKLQRPTSLPVGQLGEVQGSSVPACVFAASVADDDRSTASSITELGRALGAITANEEFRTIAAPLLGAGWRANGEKRLSDRTSYEQLRDGFRTTARPGSKLLLVVPESDRFRELERYVAGGDAGSGVQFRREAHADELCLRVAEYVGAIGEVLAAAEGETSFALFGAWGRGKTTLARQLCAALCARRDFPRYRTVWLNAWKYRSPPEVWAHLYERLSSESQVDGGLAARARVLRANIIRHGLAPITLSLFALSFALLPIVEKLDGEIRLLLMLTSTIGALAFIWLISAANKTWWVIRKIWQRYSDLPNHRDKLGLQAVIGDDLRFLLLGWVPKSEAANRARREVAGKRSLKRTRTEIGERETATTPGWLSIAACGVSVSLVGAALSYGMREHRPIAAAMAVAWMALWIAVWFLVAKVGRQVDRILLVVDDLDRCPPEQMLEVIESIKLLVDEPDFSERLQLMVLVDEQVLFKAIRHRFQHLAQGEGGGTHSHAEEHIEKLFLGYLRLGPLSADDVGELVNRFANADTSETMPRAADSGPAARTRHSEGVSHRASPTSTTAEEVAIGTTASPPPLPPTVVAPRLTGSELEALRERCKQLLLLRQGQRVGPRAIRSFLFRYQLARELLAATGSRAKPAQLIGYLLGALGEPLRAEEQAPPELARIVDQVVVRYGE